MKALSCQLTINIKASSDSLSQTHHKHKESTLTSNESSIPFSLLPPFALTANPLPGVAAGASPDPVYDITGKILRTGTGYYILPAVGGHGTGGGLAMASTGNKTCPLNVVQDRYYRSKGLPLTFTPVNPKKGVIRVSTDFNIKFHGATTSCGDSTVWKLDESTNQWFSSVTTGGVERNPGPETAYNWFKIEKYVDDYKLVFCPTVLNMYCRDLGISMDENGGRSLALSDVPFTVKFQKA